MLYGFQLSAPQDQQDLLEAILPFMQQQMQQPGMPGAPSPMGMQPPASPQQGPMQPPSPAISAMLAQPQVPMAQTLLAQRSAQMPLLPGMTPQGPARGMPQMPAAPGPSPQPQRFALGGLATSLREDPEHHDRDQDFIDTRNQQLMGMVAKPFAVGGLAMATGGGAWTRKEGQNPEGGLNAKGRASLRAQGHDIKPPVSAKQAAKSPKAAARRKSFCARMSGMPGPMKDDKGRPTRKALSLRKWDC